MLRAAQERGVDYVGGSRYLAGGSPEGLDGFSRKAISRGLALVTRLAFLGTAVRRVTDPLSGFFLFRRTCVDGVERSTVAGRLRMISRPGPGCQTSMTASQTSSAKSSSVSVKISGEYW